MSNYVMRMMPTLSVLFVVFLVFFVLLYAVFSKPKKKQNKTYGRSVIANGNGVMCLSCFETDENKRIMNGSHPRNNGIPVEQLYENISNSGVKINYLNMKEEELNNKEQVQDDE